ncbi:hypothetical protein SAMN06265219_101262 [Gracilimonas mengyeensis]|uniref:Uncharacterized protein n=1 Tax=Gracilimonas mengyeensis TaxID=1302730 RepID=A0A521AN80_9BACT|nr:hypothetical protein SAMN06265219_101262 [Gracilimonas mengyeensis]
MAEFPLHTQNPAPNSRGRPTDKQGYLQQQTSFHISLFTFRNNSSKNFELLIE